METKKVEMYVGFTNYQWNTFVVDIPLDMTEESALKYAEIKILTTLDNEQHKASEIAFIGVYNDNLNID